MAKKRNIIVGQSGGPTAVINSSLAGVYKNAIERGFDKVYGMLHGIQGLLDEQYIDLSTQIHSELDIELLKRTPSAFLGSCRFKLPEIHEDKTIYEKIFGILNRLDIDAFIYIGGNDSMDTIKKLSDFAILTGQKQKFLGVPKTIDNDLALTDHTPGFGSAAKYIGASTKEVIRDAQGLTYKKSMITIMEVMGRNAGWLTGATALARTLGMNEDMIEIIHQAALLHDVGKIGIPESVLNKAGSLTDEEYEMIKGHVEASIDIIRHLPSLDYVIPAVIGHHERYDGKGYPRRIAGEDIPLTARILCVADSFDAMTSIRCYKKAFPVKVAREKLIQDAGKQFDPELVRKFVECLDNGTINLVKAEEA